MIIRQEIPSFVDGCKSATKRFKTLSQLKKINWVKSWSDEKGFTRFSVAEPEWSGERASLMAEYKNGEYWVVGDFGKGSAWKKLNLPVWDDKPKAKKKK